MTTKNIRSIIESYRALALSCCSPSEADDAIQNAAQALLDLERIEQAAATLYGPAGANLSLREIDELCTVFVEIAQEIGK